MVDPNSAKFISSLVKSLQMFCHGYMEFEDNIEIIGHINLRIDNRQKLDYIVNEQVSKQGQESTCFQSNSYHSLPPKSHERDQHVGSRSSDLTLDSSMAVLAGTRVQVDLSGPSPVTRSTFSSYPDGFLSPIGNSQSSDSQAHGLEMEQASASSSLKELFLDTRNQIVNHSHIPDKNTHQTGHACSADSARAESSMCIAVSSDCDGQQQSVSRLLQDIVIKTEPGAFASPDKTGDSVGARGLMETSSLSDISGGHMSDVSSVAHALPSLLPSMSFTQQPVSFSASPVHLDTEPRNPKGVKQEGVLMCAVGSTGPSIIPVAAGIKPTFSVAKSDLIVLSQGTFLSSVQNLTLPVQDLTVPVSAPTDRVENSFPVLSSSNPVVKKQKVEGSQCSVCGTRFRNSRLLGMHVRLVHRRMPHNIKKLKKLTPDNDVQTPILSSSSSTIIAYVGAKNEENESGKPNLQIATDSFLELTKSQNGSSVVVKPNQPQAQATVRSGPVACCFCQILFWNNQDLSQHQKLCGQKYNSAESGEGGQTAGVCQKCQLVFADGVQLAEHRKLCVGEPALSLSGLTTCPMCQLAFPDPALLSAHLWVCGKPAASASNTGELSVCESGAASGSSGSSGVSNNVNACDKCGKVFQGRTSLVDHINSMHKGMSFKCPDCGETFKWRTCVYRHRLRCCKGKNAATATAKPKKDSLKS